jgi:hypothetical protein
VRLIASATTEWASAFGSCGRLRLPRFLPLGQPPSLAFSRAALVLAFDFTLPMRAPTLISFPQCGHFIAPEYRTVRSLHDEFQKTPLPGFAVAIEGGCGENLGAGVLALVVAVAWCGVVWADDDDHDPCAICFRMPSVSEMIFAAFAFWVAMSLSSFAVPRFTRRIQVGHCFRLSGLTVVMG